MKEPVIRYDSRSEKSKRPFGAVKNGTEVFFRVKISSDIVVRGFWIVVKYDRHESAAWYDMTPEESGHEMTTDAVNRYITYKTSVKFKDTGLYWYHFEIETDLGWLKAGRSEEDDKPVISDRLQYAGDPLPWQLTVYREKKNAPKWIYGGVYYHIFVDRFNRSEARKAAIEKGIFAYSGDSYRQNCDLSNRVLRKDWGSMPEYRPDKRGRILNNDFFGGDIAGVTEKLPYLEDLGVTCIYLSPVFEAYSNHKYDTADYSEIDREFGTDADLERLCEEAGKRGIRVILDGVFAHTGSDSIYFNKYGTYGKDGAWRNERSKYRDWYSINEDGTYDSWWGIDTLPKVNKMQPSYEEFITGRNGIARRWLRMGASGWRLDVADELPVAFMKALSAAVHHEKKDALLIGEVWEDASNKIAYDERKNYFEGDKLDSVMDYPMKDAIISFVRYADSEGIALTVERLVENYPPFALAALMNNLGTHDSIRILTALAGERIEPCLETREQQAETKLTGEEYERGVKLLKMAVLLQMTLPGVPCVYYADEAGMQGYADPFNRQCYPWGEEDQDILGWYRKLIKIRRSNDVYKKGAYRTMVHHNGCYAFSRSGANSGEIITAVNRGEKTRKLPVSGKWTDLLTGRLFDTQNTGPVEIGPDEMLLIKKTL